MTQFPPQPRSSPLLTPDQEELHRVALQWVHSTTPISRLRTRRDQDELGDADLWAAMIDAGWACLPFPAAMGGLDLGLPEVCILAEALGSTIADTPLLSALTTSVLDPSPEAAAGRLSPLAWREHPRHADRCASTWQDGRLTGHKRDVPDASQAVAFLVSAQGPAGRVVVRVDAGETAIQPQRRVDHADVASLRWQQAPATLVADAPRLDEALRQLSVARAAWQLGAAQAAFELTRSWLCERRQFGVPIGSFQVLQHRMVDMYAALELSRSALFFAARGTDPAEAATAARKTAATFGRVTREAVQLHGGIGVTDEHDIGLYLKAALVAGG